MNIHSNDEILCKIERAGRHSLITNRTSEFHRWPESINRSRRSRVFMNSHKTPELYPGLKTAVISVECHGKRDVLTHACCDIISPMVADKFGVTSIKREYYRLHASASRRYFDNIILLLPTTRFRIDYQHALDTRRVKYRRAYKQRFRSVLERKMCGTKCIHKIPVFGFPALRTIKIKHNVLEFVCFNKKTTLIINVIVRGQRTPNY